MPNQHTPKGPPARQVTPVRLSPGERQVLQNAAKILGRTLSDMLRDGGIELAWRTIRARDT